MSKINEHQIEKLNITMKTELSRLIYETHREISPESKTSINEIDGDGSDVDDLAVADVLADIDNAVISLHLQEINDLYAALDRIQNNTYGICIDCGGDVDFKRLSVYPTAKRCIKCQINKEKMFAKKPFTSF